MLPEPGAAHFVPSILAHITETSGWTPDPALFSAILLALIVRDGGLIVDVLPEKESVVSKSKGKEGIRGGSHGETERVARGVKSLYHTVFGLPTSYAHLEPSAQPSDVVAAFCPSSSPPKSPRGDVLSSSRTPSIASSRFVSVLSTPLSEMYPNHAHNRLSAPLLPAGPIVQSPDEFGAQGSRDGQVLVLTGLERCESPAWIKLVDILLQRRVTDVFGRKHQWGKGFTLVWVREAGAEAPSWLIDHFAAHAHVLASDIDSPPSPTAPQASVPPEYILKLHSLLPYVHIHPPLSLHMSNLLSALSSHHRLHTTLTGRAIRLFPEFVRAHRLLSRPFGLPREWEMGLAVEASMMDANGDGAEGAGVAGRIGGQPPYKAMGKFGVGGGKGGVETWASLAGEEPSLSNIAADAGEVWEGDGGLYVMPVNVEGVWETALRHRVRWRPERAEVMWRLKGGAEPGGHGGKTISTRRKRREVEEVLDFVITHV